MARDFTIFACKKSASELGVALDISFGQIDRPKFSLCTLFFLKSVIRSMYSLSITYSYDHTLCIRRYDSRLISVFLGNRNVIFDNRNSRSRNFANCFLEINTLTDNFINMHSYLYEVQYRDCALKMNSNCNRF